MAWAERKRVFLAARAARFSSSSSMGASGTASSASQESGSEAAQQLSSEVQQHLEHARRSLEEMLAVQGPRNIQNTLLPYDTILVHLDAASNRPGLLERVHPDAGVRVVAERATQEVDKFATELSLNREVYDALLALDVTSEDPATRFYVEKALRDYRRAGVDKDDDTRKRIRELNEDLTLIGQEFARNIQSDTRTIQVSREDLVGLPADYIRSHKPADDGHISITTDYPDYVPFMSYSRSGPAREALYKAFRTRGYPANLQVLDRMLAKRHELAQLLGYRSWAEYVTEDKMIQSNAAAREFVDRIAEIAEQRARADYAKLLEYKRRDDPGAQSVADWEKEYYEEIVKSEEYAFDSQSVRPYYAYERVKQGVLDLTARLFGVEYRKVEGAPVWSGDVETYDVYESGRNIGRFHLDMHPRSDKYKHAAQFNILNGVGGKQLPEAALICNFPGGDQEDPGLMEQSDVETFLHEFGHLLHTIFSGHQRWIGISGISTEWDFVEAPSQMLEEWARDASVLQTFARHHETDEPIPTDLVERMKRANEFGKGAFVRQQMFYAMLSLSLYDRDPKEVDTTALTKALQQKYSMYDYVEGTYFHVSFGHLDGYSAIYYTYMWSLVIAKDLFSHFDKNNLMDPGVAGRYRRAVLGAGGSAPAAQLVQDFLGRAYNFDAYEAWLNAE